METKKTNKADLERKKEIFFQIGLIISLSLVLFAFEWHTYKSKSLLEFNNSSSSEIEEIILNTFPEKKPPPLVKIIKSNQLNIVDDKKVTENITIDAGVDNKDKIDVYIEPIPIKVEKSIEEPQTFVVVERMPEFPGGNLGRKKFFEENIQYPSQAFDNNITGTVYISLIIEADGSVTNINVIRGIGSGCDEEAVRVVKLMPKWIPGMQRGKAVRVQFNLPIRFNLIY